MEIFKLFDLPGVLNADAQLLTFGLALELPPPVTVAREEVAVPDVDRCNGPVEQRPESCAVRDTDGDGVPDVEDACPNEKGTKGLKGCPDLDADNDGIKIPQDQCPDEPEDKDGYRDEDGCPDPDNDKDGVLDADDQCPLQAGPAALKGCPDADGDGVPDKDDACPLKPGPKEEGGCPVYKQIKVTETRVELLQKIQFAFGKALILSKSYGLLDEAVQALKDHPLICVRIEGHTDNVGNPKRNFTLSEDRALAVMKYLTDHGIDPLRVIGQGFGQEKPLEPNTTAEGRERNRRVEFVIRPCDAALSPPPAPPAP
jgi:outer membrane protein OmpA-like peptidoglycan-associated protein